MNHQIIPISTFVCLFCLPLTSLISLADASGSSSGHSVQKAAASFLSKLKSNFRTSQRAIDFVVKEVNSLTYMLVDYLKVRIWII